MLEVIGILGDGAQADECEDFAKNFTVAFRAVPPQYLKFGRPEHVFAIGAVPPQHLSRRVVVAVGAPAVKRDLVNQWSGGGFATVASDAAWISETAAIGDGCLIAPAAVVSARARIGRHVLVNIGATVSHDAVIGDFSTISPGANLGGRCRLGEGVFVGIGATISSDVVIASGAVIGAGAVVIEDVELQGTYVGVPARLAHETREWLRVI